MNICVTISLKIDNNSIVLIIWIIFSYPINLYGRKLLKLNNFIDREHGTKKLFSRTIYIFSEKRYRWLYKRLI